ncbi:MAG TPA: PSD1 and planctomycete cytochrome C domain-containing protein [Pirellulaceae bacterium]|jgi:hypothetical protein
MAAALLLVDLSFAARAKELSKDQVEFFEKHIRPVLVEHCYECHSAQSEKLKGKLLLDSREASLKGGESGPAVVPGNPDASLVVQALRYENYEMPPKGKLPSEVIAKFEQWVKDGAADPREGSGAPAIAPPAAIDFEAARQQLWSLRPLQPHRPPAIREASWPRQPLDNFVLQSLDASGLSHTSAASRRTWLRRVNLDLIGLPPSPAEIVAFEADESPDAAERVVDRLLASPHYGERVARMWLDLARYAEDQAHIVGKDESLLYPNAYLYRDWIINSFNSDMPYDRFVQLQLAADLLEGDDSPNVAALGLIGLGPKYYGRRSMQVMSDEWEDRVDVVGRGLLGLTVACARCHDHKFDPIGTEDYYALAGIFASTTMFNRPLSADAEKASDDQKGNKDFENGKKATGEAKDPKQSMHIVRDGEPTNLNIFIRGSVENKGPLVPRHFLRVLCQGDAQPFASGSGRRELAEAIANPANPLTARVIVNRLWGLYFGRPLAATASNFGSLGEPPTHPELLDYLALRFLEDNWSVKSLTRQLVLSRTYGQASANPQSQIPNLQFADAENKLLGHFPRHRLTVEQWRDSILAATGRLDESLGGKSIDPQQPAERRRTIYSRASRLELNKLLAMFDYPDPNVHADRRVETTTPLQKMFVLNSSFMVAEAAALAERLKDEVPESAFATKYQRIDYAYRLLYGRPATDEEMKLGLRFLASGSSDRWQEYAHVLLAANELLYVD